MAQIITQSDYLGTVMKLCIDKRGTLKNQVFITQDRVGSQFRDAAGRNRVRLLR